MQFQFSFKHMDSSDALQAYAEDKLREKIQKFVTKPVDAHVSFSVMKHEHRAHCTLRAGDGFSLEVEHSCSDMYGSVDHMVDKLGTQLKKQKEKLKDHKQPKLSQHLKEVTETGEPAVDATEILKYEAGRKKSGAR